MSVSHQSPRGRAAAHRRAPRSRSLVAALTVSLTALSPLAAPPAAVAAAPGDEVVAWVEVEDGAISGGPGFNSGDHSNFSGTGSYTFRETGMTSTMSVTAPSAGVYPIHVRYAAGPLSPGENLTRSMGLLTNGGARQQLQLPMTSLEDWEAWDFVTYDVTLREGANTVALQCDRSVDFCRVNLDAIQVGGKVPDPCVATAPKPGYTALFDGTLESFDGWRKAGAGAFGRQTDCTIRSFRGPGAEWFTQQQTAPYTLELDWRRTASDDDSAVYLASTSRGGADAVGGYEIPIGSDTGAIVPTGAPAQAPDGTALARALRPVGQWNTFRIQLTGLRVRVYLNGSLVNSMDRPRGATAAGFVGLENRSSSDEVDFRSIQLRPDVDLGELAGPFTRATLAGGGTENPGGESTLGNLVAEAQRWATRAPAYGAQIAFSHPQSLGADLLGGPGGYPAALTYRQAAAVQPAADTLVNLRLTGQQVKTVLEQQWQRNADGTVPARPFLRLGTSAGFRYTYDPTRAEGSRITGMWLDGAAVVPTSSYSVTVTSLLAGGRDNFRAFVGGTGRQDTGRSGLAALADYLNGTADPSAGGTPLAPSFAQHSVGVAFPGGSRASYAAGDLLSVDLTSLAFSTASDQQDTAVQVSLGGQSLGTFPVDNSLVGEAFDEQGRAAVRATIPAGTAAGPATVRIVGSTTGTAVEVPITVTQAAPAPSPGAPVEAQKATPTMVLKVRPGKIVAGKTRAVAAVVVAAPGFTPSGRVTLKVGRKTYTGSLSNGRVTFRLPRFGRAGTVRAVVTYAGDARTASASTTTRLKVRGAGSR